MGGLRFGGTRPANAGVGVVVFRGVFGVGLGDIVALGDGKVVVVIGDLWIGVSEVVDRTSGR